MFYQVAEDIEKSTVGNGEVVMNVSDGPKLRSGFLGLKNELKPFLIWCNGQNNF